jgi:hypothetical protein
MTLRRIVTPLASRGLFAAWLISYVFSLRDTAILSSQQNPLARVPALACPSLTTSS